MRRRDFLGVLGGAAAAPIVAPLPARTQQAMPVIGFLNGSVAASIVPAVAAFRAGLGETGFFEGRNVAIEFRWAEGDYQKLPAMAADLSCAPGRLDHRGRHCRCCAGGQGRHHNHPYRVLCRG